jgi:hypothetical protein
MGSKVKWMGKLWLYLLVISGPGAFSGYLYGNQLQVPTKNETTTLHKNLHGAPILGDYGRIIHKGYAMDTQKMIAQLKKLHVNTYYYLFNRKPAWKDLREKFLPAAQKAGINVVAYLGPPSKAVKTILPYPYGADYVQWAKAIAHLSLEYPNLTGWAMDDFNTHMNIFTPAYVKKMEQAAHKINPNFPFLPVVNYYTASCPCFYQKYSQYIGGIIFPYFGFYNLKWLPAQLDAITKVWPSQSVILLVYSKKHSIALVPPPAGYVRKALQIGLNYNKNGKLGGVVTYKLSKDPHEVSCKDYPHVLEFALGIKTHTKKGDYVEASQQVKLDPTAHTYSISFWQEDDRKHKNAKHYHIKQFLVNDQVVWHKDVRKDGKKKRYQVSLDLTPYLKGKSRARIAFRLYEKSGVSNYEVRVNFGGMQSRGFHVVNEGCCSWAFSTNGDGLFPTHQCYECDPHRQRKKFDAVEKIYGQWSRK